MHEKLMTVAEVADLFHVSKRTVYNWNNRGTGPRRIKVGSQVFYQASDVSAFIASARAES